ncbi:MAG TPA: serine hydrolase domain-containing protein [Steroidobacteraceae bacterium]|nr:serine hydrolase domain-containing protein [Steroidobacteraceae bacterium]
MRAKPRTAATVTALLSSLLRVVPAAADAIDDFVRTQLESQKVPGIAVLVMQNGNVVKQQGYGYANLELRVPVTADTLFQSGSTGKMFTAAGILLLVQEGKLRLDDRLAMYYPDAPAAWHKVSIRQLLTHTSGIKDYGEYNSGDLDYRKDYTDGELLAAMQKLPLEFEPGTQWSYSNSGYLILGLLLTKLAGKDYSEFLAERIFRPLGMQTAQLISERRITPNRAAGYELDDHGELVNQDWVAPGLNRTADGSLYFSTRDLAAWEKALEARSFMSAESFNAWWTAVHLAGGARFPYGFGWFLSEQRGEPVLQHGGAWQGFRAAIVRYPQQQLAVMVLANAAQVDAVDIGRHIAGLTDRRLEIRSPAGSQPLPDQARAASLRSVLEAWAGYRVVPAMAPTLAATAAGSAVEAHDRQRVGGELERARSLRITGADRLSKSAIELLADGTVSAVDTVLETDKDPEPVRFRLDAQGRVVGFAMRE